MARISHGPARNKAYITLTVLFFVTAAWLEAKQGKDTALHTAVKAGEEGMLRMLLAATRR